MAPSFQFLSCGSYFLDLLVTLTGAVVSQFEFHWQLKDLTDDIFVM